MPFTIKLFKKILGGFLIIFGVVIFLTPFTPGSWVFFVGLELLGVRMAVWDKLKNKVGIKK